MKIKVNHWTTLQWDLTLLLKNNSSMTMDLIANFSFFYSSRKYLLSTERSQGAMQWGDCRDHCMAQAHLSYRLGTGTVCASVIQATCSPNPHTILCCRLLFKCPPICHYPLSKLPLQVHNKFCFPWEVLGPLTPHPSTFPGALIPPHDMAFVYSSSRCRIYRLCGNGLYPVKPVYCPIPQHPTHSKRLY